MGKDRLKKGATKDEENVSKFDGFGVDFKCKLIGFTSVPAARGDNICHEALRQLTAQALRNNKEKKSHKQKITVNITLKGIRLLDEASERMEHVHPIQRISYISHDNNDKRTFGYIVGTKDGYKLFAIKAMKEAEQITKTLKELFQEVFERHQAQKNAQMNKPNSGAAAEINGEKEEPKNEVTGLVEVRQDQQDGEDPFLVDWGQLNEQIQVMQSDGIPHSDSSDMLSDLQFGNTQSVNNDPFGTTQSTGLFSSTSEPANFNPFGDAQPAVSSDLNFFAAPTETTTTSKSSDDLFALNPPSTTSPLGRDSTDAPLLMNDPFAELKKNINELHQQQQQQHMTRGFNPNFQQPNGFPPQKMNNSYMPTPAASNPFHNPNPMYSANPMTAGAYGRGPQKPPASAPVPNPFLTQPSPPQPQSQQDMGWTVTRPTPAVRMDIKKPNTKITDPFAFLDYQTGEKSPAPQPQPMSSSNSSNAVSDPFDLLG